MTVAPGHFSASGFKNLEADRALSLYKTVRMGTQLEVFTLSDIVY